MRKRTARAQDRSDGAAPGVACGPLERPGLRALFFLAFLFALSLGLFACHSASKPIKIGLSINLSGQGGTAGEYIRAGALLATQEINEAGGIDGHPIDLLVKDDRNDPEGILQADKELVKDGVVAIIGHTYSSNTLTAYPYVMKSGVLLFTPYTAASALSSKDDLFFRTAVDTLAYGRATAALLQARGIHRVAFLLDKSNPDFTQSVFQQTRRLFTGSVAAVSLNSKEQVDWNTVVSRLVASKPKAVVLLTEVTMTSMAAQELRIHGFKGDLVATIWAQTPDLINFGGRAVEGLSLVTFIDPDTRRPDYERFREALAAQFHQPATARSARAYEAIQILDQALSTCPYPPTPAALKTALLQGPFQTILGPIRFDRFGDVVRPMYDVRIRSGEFVNAGRIR